MEMHYWPPYIRSTDNRGGGITAPSRFKMEEIPMHLLLKNLCAANKAAFSASKEGAELQVKKTVPVYNFGFWSWTPEVCLDFKRETRAAVRAVFQEQSRETQRAFTFAPRKGEYVQRAKLWRGWLKPALPPAQYNEAMIKILGWLIRRAKAVSA